MREIRTSGSMSGKRKRSTLVPPRRFSTLPALAWDGVVWGAAAGFGVVWGAVGGRAAKTQRARRRAWVWFGGRILGLPIEGGCCAFGTIVLRRSWKMWVFRGISGESFFIFEREGGCAFCRSGQWIEGSILNVLFPEPRGFRVQLAKGYRLLERYSSNESRRRFGGIWLGEYHDLVDLLVQVGLPDQSESVLRDEVTRIEPRVPNEIPLCCGDRWAARTDCHNRRIVAHEPPRRRHVVRRGGGAYQVEKVRTVFTFREAP